MSRRRFLTLLLFVLASCVAAVAQTAQVIDVDEAGIRKSASKKTLPAFPESSRKRRSQGVAVVQLVYNGQGTVDHVEVLEAPDSESDMSRLKNSRSALRAGLWRLAIL